MAGALWLAGCGDRTDSGAGTGSTTPETTAGASSSLETSAVDRAQRDVDNTGINKRDRAEEALTPGDQGTSPEDRDLTRRIRRAITQNDQLSTTAKNIKIITADAKVTLRGPVNSEAERAQILALAQGAAGATTVDNQLEVKQTTQTTDERK
jgi:osmotically-inducible protein OsmY